MTTKCFLVLAAVLTACARQTPSEPPMVPPPPAAASAPTSLQQRVEAALAGYERLVTREDLAGLGEPAAVTEALVAIYKNPAGDSYIRGRALTSLQFFPGPTSRAVMEEALMAPDTSDVARRTTVKAYGAAFGAEAVPVLSALLSHEDVHTRDAAARTLGTIQGEPARKVLRKRLDHEQSGFVRKTIEAGLAR